MTATSGHHVNRLCRHAAGLGETDGELLERFAHRQDESAFAMLVGRYEGLVFGVCRRLLDESAAEDALQTTFLVLARRAGSIRPGLLAGWLFEVARRQALKARCASAKRAVGSLHDATDPRDPRRTPHDELTARELLDALDGEIQRLSMVYRVPVVLCYLEGLSQEEAARRLGCTPGAIKGRLERGRKLLHARLEKRGLTLATALAAGSFSRTAAPIRTVAATVRAVMVSGSAPAGATASVPRLVGMLAAVALVAAGVGLGIGLASSADEQRNPPRPAAEAKSDAGDPAEWTVEVAFAFEAADLAFSPDGKCLAVGSVAKPGRIEIREVATGKEVMTLLGHRGRILSLAFSPDGKTLASTASCRRVRLWEMPTGRAKVVWLPDAPAPAFHCLTFSPDGATLALAGSDGVVRLCDSETAEEKSALAGHQTDGEIETLWAAFGPGGRTITSGGDSRSLILHDVATGVVKRRVRPKNLACLQALALTPDGKILVAAETGSPVVRTWDWVTGEEQRGLDGHTRPVTCLALSGDGNTLATGSWDRTVCLWDLPTHSRTAVFRADKDAIRRVALAPDGRVVAFAHGQTVEIRRVPPRSK